MKREGIFVTDCEGPVSKNDNAFELACRFIPGGEKFFALISKYDDVLAEILRRPGWEAGNTLKLILPFLKAYGVTDEKMGEYSARSILLVPGAMDTLRFVRGIMPAYIVSTSYEPYVRALCEIAGFPFVNVYCTKVNVDRYELSGEERRRLMKLREEVVAMPMIEVPEKASSLEDFSENDRRTIMRLDEIFEEISEMRCGRILEEVKPVGGVEKARAVEEIAAKHEAELSNIIYFGDSITDVESFRLMRKSNGLAVSFNGNEYAVKEAEIAVLAEHTVVTSILADAFNRLGKNKTMELAENWGVQALKACSINGRLLEELEDASRKYFIRVEAVTSENVEDLCRESAALRRKVRGEKVGGLG